MTSTTPPGRRRGDPLAHRDPDRHPVHGPMGTVYTAVYLIGFFGLMPVCAFATIASMVNSQVVPGAIGLAGTLCFGAAARAAWRRMP
jgi:hypothetical protein